jgi:hypothetical protein
MIQNLGVNEHIREHQIAKNSDVLGPLIELNLLDVNADELKYVAARYGSDEPEIRFGHIENAD